MGISCYFQLYNFVEDLSNKLWQDKSLYIIPSRKLAKSMQTVVMLRSKKQNTREINHYIFLSNEVFGGG